MSASRPVSSGDTEPESCRSFRAASAKGEASAAHFDAALAPLLPLLDTPRDNPSLYQALAEIYEARAAWLMGRRKAADDDISKARAMADEALARNPRARAALAVKDRLRALETETETKTETKTKAP